MVGLGRVGHAGVPEVLVEQGDALFDGGGEVAVAADQAGQPLAVIVVNFIQDGVDAFLEVALGFPVNLVEHAVELDHGSSALRHGALIAVAHQLQDAVLHEHHRHFLVRYALQLEVVQVVVNAVEGQVYGVLAFVVHAHTAQHLDLQGWLFLSLEHLRLVHLAEFVYQAVSQRQRGQV